MKAAKPHIKKQLQQLVAEEDADEEPATPDEITLADGMATALVPSELLLSQYQGLSLAAFPIDQWGAIRVSPLSLFGDNKWDFSSFPCPSGRPNVQFDYENQHGINVASGPRHCLNLLKALVFYKIPTFSFSGLNRSYGSVATSRNRLLTLINFIEVHKLYAEAGSNGMPSRTADDLPKEVFSIFLEKERSINKKWELASAMQYWQRLSRSKLLPPVYAISTDFVSDDEVAQLRRQLDESANPFEPIPLDDYAEIVSFAASIVIDGAKDLLWLARTFLPTLVGAGRGGDEIGTGLSCASEEGVAAFKSYLPRLVDGKPWWKLKVRTRSHPRDKGEYLSYGEVASYVQSLFDCCIAVIFATTGMRRSELRFLEVDCTHADEAGHWLTFDVFKTSVASQGDAKRIPIPRVTFKAIQALQELCSASRQYGKHRYLLSSLNRAHFGHHPNAVFAERALSRVAAACDISANIHSHRFRKSLAMYIIYQDSRNIELIRHLFSHKSLRMTLRYILSLPGVNDELRRYLITQNVEILEEVLTSAESNRIGGRGGLRVQQSIASAPIFSGRLQDRGKETLEQYVDSLLDAGIKLLHRTNLAICIRTPNLNDTVPCIGKSQSAAERLHPNLFACEPFSCNYAVFTEAHVERLHNEARFHTELQKHPYCGKAQADYSSRRVREISARLAEIALGSNPEDRNEPPLKYG